MFTIDSQLEAIGPSAFTGTALTRVEVPRTAAIAINSFDQQVDIIRMQQ